MATLYLHIGTPKTGTSAIQNFMAINSKQLKNVDYYYPDFKKRFPGIGCNRNGHFLIHKIYDKLKNNEIDKENELVTKCLDKILKSTKLYSNIVLSDEGIWHGARKKDCFWVNLKKQLDERNINLKIIVYLRRQDSFIQSFWAQQVKETSTILFSNYISERKYEKCILDYYTCINEVAQVVGKENMIVRIYGEQSSIISDFLNCLNLELTDNYEMSDSVINTSLSGSCLEVKRLLNHMPEFKQKLNYLSPLLCSVQEELFKKGNFRKTKYFSYDMQQQFLNQYEKGNSALAREYLNREDGILFKNDTKYDKTSIADTFSAYEMISVCGAVIALQQEIINKTNKKIINLNRVEVIFKKMFTTRMKNLIRKITKGIRP